MRSCARQAGDITKEPELIAEGPRKSKGGNRKDKNATLRRCLGLYSKEQSVAGCTSPAPCWPCQPALAQLAGSTRKLVLRWPTLCMFATGWEHVSRLFVGSSQCAATCHCMACCWRVAALNTVQGFNKHTVLPGQLCSAYCLEDNRIGIKRPATSAFNAYPKGLSQSVCRTEAKHLGGHGQQP